MKELFGQRLREQRQNQGLTMEQLAEKANLSTNFIGAIERGLKEPSLSTLISILNALDIPADVLLRDYVGTASHVTDEEICKRLEGLTPIQKKGSTRLAGHLYCQSPISYKRRIICNPCKRIGWDLAGTLFFCIAFGYNHSYRVYHSLKN